MIDYIEIKNFKIFKAAEFSLAALNVFSGLNGMGKSSLIQALLLLRQSHEQKMLDRGLLLQGSYLNLGVGRDVLSEDPTENMLSIALAWDQNKSEAASCCFRFDCKADSDFLPRLVDESEASDQGLLNEPNLEQYSVFNNHFQYLSADRMSPSNQHERSDYQVNTLNTIGQRGEYAVHYLAEHGSTKLSIPELNLNGKVHDSLLANVEAWMRQISPGVKITAMIRPELNKVSLSFSFVQGQGVAKARTNEFRPQNVGFGLSYVLPVVVCILKAKKGDLLIIENPESHLHPSGQAAMARLCARAAQNGVQLIIETHSDHVINGIRVAVKHEDIDASNVKLYFLHRDPFGSSHTSSVVAPRLNQEGKLDIWPDGFFDQWDKHLDELL